MEKMVKPSHTPEVPSPDQQQFGEPAGRSKIYAFLAALVGLFIIAGMIVAIIAMVQSPQQTETIRDIVIIFMAAESLVIGVALIVLVIQIARLTAMLQQEVRPILESTEETINTLRGTSTFLSDKMVKPVMKATSTVAAVRRVLDLVNPSRSKQR
jgi:fructose-specific phosphotransferase system IIC component